MSRPVVSVVLPVRDGGALLEGCLRSLQRQTVTDLEVVAVDDGSADSSGELLDRWVALDHRFRVLHLPPSGLVAALNAGVEACRSPLVARMDADDVSHPRRLELQLRLLEALPEVGVVSCLVRHVPWQRVAGGFRLYEAWLNSLTSHEQLVRERFVESPLAHPSVVVRRRLLVDVGGYRDRGWPEDYDLWLRLFGAGVRFAKVERLLYFWRERPDRLSRVGASYTRDAFLRCKAHFLAAGPLATTPRVVVWGAGQTGRRLSRHLLAERVTIEAFVDIDPRTIGRAVRGRPVLSPDRLESLLGGGTVVLAAVASRGARDLIRFELEALGLTEGETYWCVA